MAPTPDDIDAIAQRARAEAEAAAIRGRAEVDATAALASAAADAVAVRARAELEADEMVRAAAADRQEAERSLAAARLEAESILAQAADVRRLAEQQTLDRLLATRADLHDAIERLTEVSEPVLDLTDRTMAETATDALATAPAELPAERDPEPGDDDLGDLVEGGGDDGPAASEPGNGDVSSDPVETLVRAAIGRAVESASAAERARPGASEEPARRRKQLRDGRNVL